MYYATDDDIRRVCARVFADLLEVAAAALNMHPDTGVVTLGVGVPHPAGGLFYIELY